jgi:hypothetical protein
MQWGLAVNLPDIIDHDANIQLISEADIAEHDVPSVTTDIKEHDKHILYGESVRLSKTEHKRIGRRVAAM